jgi:hypothetical protein
MSESNGPGLTEAGRRSTPDTSGHGRKAGRRVRLALVGGVAALAAALAVLFSAPNGQIPGRTSDGGRAVINLAAARFLDRAAAAALNQSATAPRLRRPLGVGLQTRRSTTFTLEIWLFG